MMAAQTEGVRKGDGGQALSVALGGVEFVTEYGACPDEEGMVVRGEAFVSEFYRIG